MPILSLYATSRQIEIDRKALCSSLERGAEEHKISGGPSQSEHSVHQFMPMAVETFGGWGLESRPVLATFADRISHCTGQAKSCVTDQPIIPKIGHHSYSPANKACLL